MENELDITAALQTLEEPQNIDHHFVREVAFMVDDGYISALPAAILSNAAEVRRQLSDALEKYRNLVVTEDTVDDAKSTLANLRKQMDLIDSQRKDVKKNWEKPLKAFEGDVKKLVEEFTAVIEPIAAQVKSFEETEKRNKENSFRLVYETEIGEENLRYRPWESVFDPKWTNRTAKRDKIMDELKKIADRVKDEVRAIRMLGSEFEVALLDHYAEHHDLTSAISYNERLKIQKQVNDAQSQAQALQEKTKAEMRVYVAPDEETPVKAVFDDSASFSARTILPTEDEDEETVSIAFRVECTKSQLQKLKEFLVENKIKYGKV